MSRVDGYGRIDRTRTVTITVDGVLYTGHPGDTVASVLLAHDARPATTSVKLGRPRGIAAACALMAGGALHDHHCTPGSVQSTSASAICTPGWASRHRHVTDVSSCTFSLAIRAKRRTQPLRCCWAGSSIGSHG